MLSSISGSQVKMTENTKKKMQKTRKQRPEKENENIRRRRDETRLHIY